MITYMVRNTRSRPRRRAKKEQSKATIIDGTEMVSTYRRGRGESERDERDERDETESVGDDG